MAEHDVSLEIPRGIEVGKRDLKIRVWSDGIRFGTLTISKGAIEARWDIRFFSTPYYQCRVTGCGST